MMKLYAGLHSWLFYAKREQDRKANYLGYIDKLDLSGVSHTILTRPYIEVHGSFCDLTFITI